VLDWHAVISGEAFGDQAAVTRPRIALNAQQRSSDCLVESS
jgi:hypothetical protein